MPELVKFFSSLDIGQLTTAGGFIAFLIWQNWNYKKDLQESRNKHENLMKSVIDSQNTDITNLNESIATLEVVMSYLKGWKDV